MKPNPLGTHVEFCSWSKNTPNTPKMWQKTHNLRNFKVEMKTEHLRAWNNYKDWHFLQQFNCDSDTLIEKDHLGDRSPEKDCC